MGIIKRPLTVALIAAVALALAFTPAMASGKKKFKEYKSIVDAKFVKDIVDGTTPGVIVDSRPVKKKYNKAHIPGAISIPFSQFDKMTGKLPKDKGALVVFYCGGFA